MLTANVSPTCSPCGHVMQPVGPRTLWERQIGGQAASFWPGTEYECVCCRTRTVLVEAPPFVPGSVGHAALWQESEAREAIPAKRFVCAEHLPPDVRRDSHRIGGTRHLSQRQAAARIVEDFFAIDGSDPLVALDGIARALGVDVPAALRDRASSILAMTNGDDTLTPIPGYVNAGMAENGAVIARRDAEGRIVGVPDDDWGDDAYRSPRVASLTEVD